MFLQDKQQQGKLYIGESIFDLRYVRLYDVDIPKEKG